MSRTPAPDAPREARTARRIEPADRAATLVIAAALTLVSTVLLLRLASPEFSWDEADYLSSVGRSWSVLWRTFAYHRHFHGPMSIYLARLGLQVLPRGFGSIETRLRFFDALAGSLSVGFVYWGLRQVYATSRSAAIAGASLLLFSVIRLQETNVVGPHHLMLACTVALMTFGYGWLDRPSWRAAAALGVVLALGAVSMTYIIPAALAWIAAGAAAHGRWVRWDRAHLLLTWHLVAAGVIAVVLVCALWPPGVVHDVIAKDFLTFVHYASFPTIVGGRLYDATPHWAIVYWFAHLELPLFAGSVAVMLGVARRLMTGRRPSPKDAFLATSIAFFVGTAIAAHLAGARNILQIIGVLAVATGAWLDDVATRPRVVATVSAAIVTAAAMNAFILSRSPAYTPLISTDGYQTFLQTNAARAAEPVGALALDVPQLKLYAEHLHVPLGWTLYQVPFEPDLAFPPPPDAKYALLPASVYDFIGPDHPLRTVTEEWRVVWSSTGRHAWDLRLYERPPAE